MSYRVGVISGDGIGPEIVAEARKVLDCIGEKYGHTFEYEEILMGGCSIDATGEPLTEQAIAQAKGSDAVLMGSIGGNTSTSPWYQLPPNLRPELPQTLLSICCFPMPYQPLYLTCCTHNLQRINHFPPECLRSSLLYQRESLLLSLKAYNKLT